MKARMSCGSRNPTQTGVHPSQAAELREYAHMASLSPQTYEKASQQKAHAEATQQSSQAACCCRCCPSAMRTIPTCACAHTERTQDRHTGQRNTNTQDRHTARPEEHRGTSPQRNRCKRHPPVSTYRYPHKRELKLPSAARHDVQNPQQTKGSPSVQRQLITKYRDPRHDGANFHTTRIQHEAQRPTPRRSQILASINPSRSTQRKPHVTTEPSSNP